MRESGYIEYTEQSLDGKTGWKGGNSCTLEKIKLKGWKGHTRLDVRGRLTRENEEKVVTYQNGRQRRQLHIIAALDQRLAAAPEVDDAIATVVHAHLEAGDDEHRVTHVGDACGAIHNAANDQAPVDVSHGEGGGRAGEVR